MRRRVELATVLALLTALAIWVTWGALEPLPVVQDEYSYVLQSQIFAHGRWTSSPLAVPSSFQQAHVLSSPRVASKYPPGHALILSLGSALGEPWLMPLVLSGISAALVFLLADSIAGPVLGVVCWALWLSDPVNLRFGPGYFSELTSGTMWLASWWFLQRWRSDKSMHWLLGLAGVVGWMAITRPLTALSFAVPVGAWVLSFAIRRHLLRQLVLALLVGTAVLGILPFWCVRTTGKWSLPPEELYRRNYLPFDKPGFGLDTTPPRVALSPVNADVYSEFAREHRRYSLEHVPVAAADRVRALFTAEWGGRRILIIPFVVIGIAFAGQELWFTIACACALFLGYLSYAHWPGWTLYYFEAIPVAAFCAANGVQISIGWTRSRITSPRLVATLAAMGTLSLALLTAANIMTWRQIHIDDARYDTAFNKMIAGSGVQRAVIFVRYAPNFHPHSNVVRNSATLATDSIWIAIDDPAKNDALLRAANGRVPLLFDEESGSLRVYTSLLLSPTSDVVAR